MITLTAERILQTAQIDK